MPQHLPSMNPQPPRPPFFPYTTLFRSQETMELYDEMMERSIIASSILGVKWAVLHPVGSRETEFDIEADIQENVKFHGPVVELDMKHNVWIAFVNMIENLNF